MGIVEGMNGLRDIIPELDKRFRYAVEVRDSSWFQDLAYSFFANNNMCMVWSQLVGIRTPPIVTSDFLYIRFIGDRTIQEKDFGKIQKDRVSEMKKWARFLKRAREEQREINLSIVAQIIIMLDLVLELLTLLEKCWIYQKWHGIILSCLKQKKHYLLGIQNKLVYRIF